MNEENKNQVLDTNPQGGTTPKEPVEPAKTKDAPRTYTEAELDRRIQQAVATNTKNVKEQLAAYYEEEAKKNQAKATDEEVNKKLALFEEQMNQQRKEANMETAESMLKEYGFSKEEIEFYTKEVTHDKETSLAKITQICKFRKANDEIKQKAYEEKMSSQFGRGLNSGTTDNESTLQKEYDEAKKKGELAKLSAISRRAQSKGIKLNF